MSRRNWLTALLLIALVVAAYWRVFSAGFIWDDDAHLTKNACVIGPLGLKEIWTTTQAVYYPLVLTTFWALHKIVGLTPWPYHALNVVLHCASIVVLWRVLRQLQIPGAWLGAAFWGLHPAVVQSVAWVTELKNTESALFYLLSILSFLQFSAESAGARRWSRCAVSLLFFVLALLAKPSVVVLPAVLWLCLWWKNRRVSWADMRALIPFAALSALASAWTIWEQKFHAGAMGSEWAQTPAERLIIAGRAIWFYLGKLVFPHPLIFIYPRWQIDASSAIAYGPVLALLIGLAVLGLRQSGNMRAILFAVAYFVVALFPVLGFFDVYFFRYSFVSDHFQYLPSMGPLALAGAAVSKAMTRLKWASFLRPAMCGALLALLTLLTWRQTAIYHDLVTLYTATLANNPGCWMAHYNLGIALRDRGEKEQAISHYREAIALRPSYAEAHYNLARLLVEKGEASEAIVHYEKTLLIHPDDAEAHNNLGAALFESGRVVEAVAHYQKALALRPSYAEALFNLGNAFVASGDARAAIPYYLAGLELSPNQVEAQYNLASALLRNGRTAEAIDHYERAVELMPNNADVHANLGTAYLQQGRPADAIAHYKKALAIAPENVAAQTNLAWLLATCADPRLRNGPDAVELAERLNRLSAGKEPVVLRILAAAYAEAGRFNEAVDTAEQALRLAEWQVGATLGDALRKEIALYRSGAPYHKDGR